MVSNPRNCCLQRQIIDSCLTLWSQEVIRGKRAEIANNPVNFSKLGNKIIDESHDEKIVFIRCFKTMLVRRVRTHPPRCTSTNRHNPPIQQKHCNFWNNHSILMSFQKPVQHSLFYDWSHQLQTFGMWHVERFIASSMQICLMCDSDTHTRRHRPMATP